MMDFTKKFHYGISIQVIYPVFCLYFVCVSVLVCADERMFICVGVQGYLQVLVHMCVHICRGLKGVVECLPQQSLSTFIYLRQYFSMNLELACERNPCLCLQSARIAGTFTSV